MIKEEHQPPDPSKSPKDQMTGKCGTCGKEVEATREQCILRWLFGIDDYLIECSCGAGIPMNRKHLDVYTDPYRQKDFVLRNMGKPRL
jgi:hypothetical protein